MEKLIGKFVKIVFRDGEECRVIKGDVISFDGIFLTIKTLSHTHLLKRDTVERVSVLNGRGGKDDLRGSI